MVGIELVPCSGVQAAPAAEAQEIRCRPLRFFEIFPCVCVLFPLQSAHRSFPLISGPVPRSDVHGV